MRVDANVSVRRPGDEFGTRCEIKNLNSLRSLVRAIEYEITRQVERARVGWHRGSSRRGTGTRTRARPVALRSKEEAFDYRYFPEPDLVRRRPRRRLAGRGGGRRGAHAGRPPGRGWRRCSAPTGSSAAQADQIATVVEHGLDALMTAAVDAGIGAALALARTANEASAEPERARALDPAAYTALLRMEQDGTLSATQAKDVLGDLLEHGRRPGRAGPSADGYEALAADSLVARHRRAHRRPSRRMGALRRR